VVDYLLNSSPKHFHGKEKEKEEEEIESSEKPSSQTFVLGFSLGYDIKY
jgi:hypothetical protein